VDQELTRSAARVQAALAAAGLEVKVREMPVTTRSAQEAAAAIGCSVAEIAKTVVFKRVNSGRPVLVVASGVNRVDPAMLEGLCGEPAAQAKPDFVRAATGFVIGGVPPVGFEERLETWIDEDLLVFTEVWAAAGTPFAVFAIDPARLAGLTGGTVARISRVRQ